MIIHYNAKTGEITGVTTFSNNPKYNLNSDPSIVLDSCDLKILSNKIINLQTKELEDRV